MRPSASQSLTRTTRSPEHALVDDAVDRVDRRRVAVEERGDRWSARRSPGPRAPRTAVRRGAPRRPRGSGGRARAATPKTASTTMPASANCATGRLTGRISGSTTKVSLWPGPAGGQPAMHHDGASRKERDDEEDDRRDRRDGDRRGDRWRRVPRRRTATPRGRRHVHGAEHVRAEAERGGRRHRGRVRGRPEPERRPLDGDASSGTARWSGAGCASRAARAARSRRGS